MGMGLENPAVRWGIGLLDAAVIAVVALTVLDGTVRLAALGIAAVGAVTTPMVLGRAVDG